MSDSTFGGSRSSGSASDSGFDFFGGNGAPQGSTGQQFGSAPSMFGSGAPAAGPGPAPVVSASPSFGTPAFGSLPGPSFGAPSGPSGFGLSHGTPAMQVKSGRTARGTFGMVVLALAIVLGGFRLWNFYEHHRALTVPSVLGGIPLNVDPTSSGGLEQAKQKFAEANRGFNVDGGLYGTLPDAFAMMIARGNANATGEMQDMGGERVSIGADLCSTTPTKTALACIRTGGQLTVIIVAPYGDGDLKRIAALVDEAWAQQ